MKGYIEGIKIVSSSLAKAKPYGKIQSRATHGFIFKIKGCSEYFIGGESVRVNEGEMIFLPEGLSYEYRTDNSEGSLYTSINFLADIECPEVRVYSMENFYKLGYIYQSFSESWRFGSPEDKYACMSVLYELLAYISKSEQAEDEKRKYSIIEPAVEYMKKHIHDTRLRVDRLHTLCGISDTYFRRIFKARFGITPKEYIIEERITHARSIIDSGDFDSIREVAELVGFSDALYFSKAFKRVYGVPPSGIKG
jgi:AraC-like DNA-binding protein